MGNVILGETVQEAKRKKAALDNALTLDRSALGMPTPSG
jgi:hypothetical protein